MGVNTAGPPSISASRERNKRAFVHYNGRYEQVIVLLTPQVGCYSSITGLVSDPILSISIVQVSPALRNTCGRRATPTP